MVSTLGTVFTSPTLYVSFAAVYASDACKSVGYLKTSTIIAIPTTETLQSLWALPRFVNTRELEEDEGQWTLATNITASNSATSTDYLSYPYFYTATASFNISDLLHSRMPYSIYASQPSCASWLFDNRFSGGSPCPTAEPYRPIIVIPDAVLQSLDPQWVGCSADLCGYYDPPRRLTPAASIAEPSMTAPNSVVTTPALPASKPSNTGAVQTSLVSTTAAVSPEGIAHTSSTGANTENSAQASTAQRSDDSGSAASGVDTSDAVQSQKEQPAPLTNHIASLGNSATQADASEAPTPTPSPTSAALNALTILSQAETASPPNPASPNTKSAAISPSDQAGSSGASNRNQASVGNPYNTGSAQTTSVLTQTPPAITDALSILSQAGTVASAGSSPDDPATPTAGSEPSGVSSSGSGSSDSGSPDPASAGTSSLGNGSNDENSNPTAATAIVQVSGQHITAGGAAATTGRATVSLATDSGLIVGSTTVASQSGGRSWLLHSVGAFFQILVQRPWFKSLGKPSLLAAMERQ